MDILAPSLPTTSFATRSVNRLINTVQRIRDASSTAWVRALMAVCVVRFTVVSPALNLADKQHQGDIVAMSSGAVGVCLALINFMMLPAPVQGA